jgi:hypothetical protein
MSISSNEYLNYPEEEFYKDRSAILADLFDEENLLQKEINENFVNKAILLESKKAYLYNNQEEDLKLQLCL